MELTAVHGQVPEGGYVAWLQEVPGACTQGETLEEVRANLRDVMQWVFEASRDLDDARHAELPAVRERFRITVDDGPLSAGDQHQALGTLHSALQSP